MIRNIAFDLGGVVVALSYEQAVKRFEGLGLRDARKHLDAFCQKGIFGDLEKGMISPEEFRAELSQLVGRELSHDECKYAWHGYVEAVPQKNLQMLLRLRELGYKVCLLSNTNPYMMQWAKSNEFDGNGHSIEYYFDHLYLSYECKQMKPSVASNLQPKKRSLLMMDKRISKQRKHLVFIRSFLRIMKTGQSHSKDY